MSAEMAKKESSDLAAAAERIRGGVTYTPRIDIVETEEELLLCADVPGVDPDGLDVRFENHELVIEAKVAPRNTQKKSVYAEYGIGDFYRVFALGDEVDAGKISAELANGVLTVHLPKSESVRPKRIEVKCG